MESGGDTGAKQLLLARKFREALFKAGLTCGYARVCMSVIFLERARLTHQPSVDNQRTCFPA